jgi:serine/threonine protein kinase
VGTRFINLRTGKQKKKKKTNKYVIHDEIAAGGYGAVYEVKDDLTTVIKVEQIGLRTPEQFLNEVFIQIQLAEKGSVVNIEECEIAEYDRQIFGNEAPGKCWFYVLVLKRYPMTLEKVIKDQKPIGLKTEAIQKISIQLTLGLDAIHKGGIIHCDLKPQNIMVDINLFDRKSLIKLLFIDFGLCERYIVNGMHVEPR